MAKRQKMAKRENYFDPVDTKVNFALVEEELINYWKKNKIFEKSLNMRPENKTWTFLDGPPFITGTPHYGSLLSSIPKDLFPRFWTMKGYRVRRVWGWDCHGLPAENKVEKKLGIKRKRDIEEKVGVGKFIAECKAYVSEVSSEWEWYVDHIARWVDFKNAYRTMDKDYMESVMWVFKSMYDKGFIYKGLRVSLYCPHCSTPISNFEVAMDPDNYKTIRETATTYKYRLKNRKDTFLLAWSTTPWNKIVTPALAINPKLTYVEVKEGEEHYILAEDTLGVLRQATPYKVINKFKGSELLGKEFELHYDFYPIEKDKRAGVVIPGDFVTADEGTGIVTIAAYGEDDLRAMEENNIQIYLHVDDEGIIKNEVPTFGGKYYLDVNEEVDTDLDKRGLVYQKDPYKHSVAHCWRCGTRLFYAPQDAWYVDVQKLKGEMKKTNEFVNWVPKHFKKGRFLKSMEAAPDWCISRSRFWGSPVPVWQCECNEQYVVGSFSELEVLTGKKITDLHKPGIDEVTIKCKKCGGVAKRVPEVLDSWIEAGSASFAERHYPFENESDLDKFFPPDFIVEYTGQIRAWFYVLHVIANALKLRKEEGKNKLAENVVVTGVILGTDGRKMSKNYGNYPDPKELLKRYGGDALRLYLMESPVMKGEDILISEEHYREQIKNFMLILWNAYNFFVTYANVDNWKPGKMNGKSGNVLDEWILAKLNALAAGTTEDLENYDTVSYIANLKSFVDDLSKWYIRRSRDRVGPGSENEKDRNCFYETVYRVLTEYSKIVAPIVPFLSESIYKNLTKEVSVHLADWPEGEKLTAQNEKLVEEMSLVREVVEKGHAIRKEKGIPVRQPLSLVTINGLGEKLGDYLYLIKDELNVKEVELSKKGKALSVKFDIKITPELEEEAKARELIRKIQEERKNMGVFLDQKIEVSAPWIPSADKLLEKVRKVTLAKELRVGEFEVKPLK